MTKRVQLSHQVVGHGLRLVMVLIVGTLVAFGCTKVRDDVGTEPVQPTADTDDCVGCHSSKDKIIETADPLPPPPGEGAGEG